MRYDAIISGAGPAGSTLARLLARAGLEVLVLEKEMMPRTKPCGGAVSVKTARLLDFPWQESVEDVIHTVVFNFMGSNRVAVRTASPVAYMVTRSAFDKIMAEQAKRAGAHTIEGCAAKEVCIDNDRVTVCSGDKTFQGKIFIGADGAKGAAARLLGMHRPRGTGPTLEAELECPPETLIFRRGRVTLDCGAVPRGYGWIFPKKSRLSAGVAAFTRSLRKVNMEKQLKNLIAREGLNGSKVLSLRGYPIPIDGGQKKKIHCRLGLLLGDAAGLVDPFSGEGIYYAVKSAHLAAEAILDHKTALWRAPDYYQRLVDRHITGELAIARQIAKIFYSFPKQIFQVIEKHPGIAEELCNIAGGRKSYSEIRESGTKLWSLIPAGITQITKIFPGIL